MTRRLILVLPLALCLAATVACPKDAEPPVEELPAEIAATLQPLPGTEVLVGSPRPSAPVGEIFPGPLPAPRECESTQDFFSYILFPITFCSPAFDFGDVLTTYQAATTPPDLSVPGGIPEDRVYRLSSLQGQRRTPALNCRTKSGPWGATIQKKQLCNGATVCTLALGCAGCPAFLWGGDNCETTGRPPEVIFIPELHPRPLFIQKCPGSLSSCTGEDPDPDPVPPPA